MNRITPPIPPSRPDGASWWERLRLFRSDMFRSQPARLYRAKMAEMRGPGYRSYFLNTPELVETALVGRPEAFPKAEVIGETLRPLLGRSVFVTNGAEWARQRRLIDPAFAAAGVRSAFPAMQSAGAAALARWPLGRAEVEFETAHLAADVIFRTLFSIPITEARASAVFHAFRAFQRSQPLLSPPDLLRLPRWLPRRKRGRADAAAIRGMLAELVAERVAVISAGAAPDDLATAIMTAEDPEGGAGFSPDEMVDQVAIFFLAGHETSAASLSWALWCLAADSEAQEAVAQEVEAVVGAGEIGFGDIAKLSFTRDVLREVLRLYPPVPMMVRQTTEAERFRDRSAAAGSLAILSPWHLQRHERLWPDPHLFDPWRWGREETKPIAHCAYLPFSKGPRLCTGAGFAMVELVLMLAMLVRALRFETTAPDPVPVAHLTVRSEAGIYLSASRR